MVHFDGLHFRGDSGGGEQNSHTGLQDTSFDTSDGHSSDTTNLVHILDWKTESLVSGADRGLEFVDSGEESVTLPNNNTNNRS